MPSNKSFSNKNKVQKGGEGITIEAYKPFASQRELTKLFKDYEIFQKQIEQTRTMAQTKLKEAEVLLEQKDNVRISSVLDALSGLIGKIKLFSELQLASVQAMLQQGIITERLKEKLDKKQMNLQLAIDRLNIFIERRPSVTQAAGGFLQKLFGKDKAPQELSLAQVGELFKQSPNPEEEAALEKELENLMNQMIINQELTPEQKTQMDMEKMYNSLLQELSNHPELSEQVMNIELQKLGGEISLEQAIEALSALQTPVEQTPAMIGGKAKVSYKGKKYVLRTGEKGGKYILVGSNKKKVYMK